MNRTRAALAALPLATDEIRHSYLEESELLDFLEVCKTTLQRWDAQGKAPPKVVLPGRRNVYLKKSVFAWMEARQQERKPRRRGGAR